MNNTINHSQIIYDDMLFIIVLYNTSLANAITIETLSKSYLSQKCKNKLNLFIYDNSPNPIDLSSKYADIWDIFYINDTSNPGVSKAYNEGAKHAKLMSKKWIMLLDQDTNFPLNTLKTIFESISEHERFRLFAPILKSNNTIVSPSIYKFKRGFSPKFIPIGVNSLENLSPVNSGIIVNLALFFRSGGYNERIRLDFSDFYFIDKLKPFINEFFVMDITASHDLSSYSIQSLSSAKFRYQTYCEGAKISVKTRTDFLILFSVCLIRGLKLIVKYKNTSFLTLFYTCYIKK